MNQFIKQQQDIRKTKKIFTDELSKNLNLIEVISPLFFEKETGEQDGLSGTEKSVEFKSKANGKEYEVVHSLAKWKRNVLSIYDFKPNSGLFTDMRAIRAHEEKITEIHSMYVDQWDWERVIETTQRDIPTLKKHARLVYKSIYETAVKIDAKDLLDFLPEELFFIHSEKLLALYPDKTPKEREHLITKKYGAVFIIGIGGSLSDGNSHDVRASDYDDWLTLDNNGYKGLNGDLVVWCPPINKSLELSSMGIRVDADCLLRQLKLTKELYKQNFPWHKKLLNGDLYQTIGGGIGQSRVIMFLHQYDTIHDFKTSVV